MRKVSGIILSFFMIIGCQNGKKSGATQVGDNKDVLPENPEYLDQITDLYLAQEDSASEEVLGVKTTVDRKESQTKFKQKLLKEYDSDGDGSLSKQEFEAAKAAIKEKAKKRIEEIKKKIIEENDQDGDGKLSSEEKEAALKKKIAEIKGKIENIRKLLDQKCGVLKDELKEFAKKRQEIREKRKTTASKEMQDRKEQREAIGKMIEDFKNEIEVLKDQDASMEKIKEQSVEFKEQIMAKTDELIAVHREAIKKAKEEIKLQKEAIKKQHESLFKCYKDAFSELNKEK